MNRGYTLLELLITTVILVAVSACLVFNFSKSNENSKLNEGVSNIQTLFLFSKAHSQNTGKQVKIIFPESESGDVGESLREKYPNETVVVLVDNKPLESVKIYVDIINEYVNVESSNNSEVTFYPDGMSSDMVVTVSSTSDEDLRKVEISITDFTTKVKESSTQDPQ
jgi:prepilin-type N-terminal cleavage/methylation domain-containing protein